jgi:hypothetical protein
MAANRFYSYYLFLVVGVSGMFFAMGYWNQYRLSGRNSEYYTAIGTFLFSLSALVYFITLSFKMNNNAGWLYVTLFMIIPAIIFNTGIVIRTILYGVDNRPSLRERLRVTFGIPKSKKVAIKMFPRKDLLYLGLTGYIVSLILSSVYNPKDFLIIVTALTSELLLVVAPLKKKATRKIDVKISNIKNNP